MNFDDFWNIQCAGLRQSLKEHAGVVSEEGFKAALQAAYSAALNHTALALLTGKTGTLANTLTGTQVTAGSSNA